VSLLNQTLQSTTENVKNTKNATAVDTPLCPTGCTTCTIDGTTCTACGTGYWKDGGACGG
jgi:hypothetical protein